MRRDWGYVYAITGAGKIKIGITQEPSRRLRNLSLMCPVDLEMICHRSFSSMELAGKVERMLHADLAAHRWRGEWFNVSAKVAVAAIEGAYERYGDPDAGPGNFAADMAAAHPSTPPVDLTEHDAKMSEILGYDFPAMRRASKSLEF